MTILGETRGGATGEALDLIFGRLLGDTGTKVLGFFLVVTGALLVSGASLGALLRHSARAAQKTAVDQLKSALQQLNNKIEEAKRKKNLLIARAKRAEAQKTIAETMDGISNTSAFETMSRMEEKIDKAEAEAQATYELAQTANGDDLKAKFDALEKVEAEDALAALETVDAV